MSAVELQQTSLFLSAERSREELDRDYSPSRFIGSLAPVLEDWRNRTAEQKRRHGDRFRAALPYGSHPRAVVDLYRTEASGAPLLVFIHGGFWQAVSKDESGFMADAWTAAGINLAVLDYPLTPEVSLSEIVRQVRRGLFWLQEQAGALGVDASRMVIAGHSAGAHLAAMSQIGAGGTAVVRAGGLALLSGVFELEPIRHSYVNEAVCMTPAEATALSPVRSRPERSLPLVVAVGENEPTAFHEQSRHLAWQWREAGCPTANLLLSRRDHFSLLDELADLGTPLGRAVAGLLPEALSTPASP
ncbi:alpha/beta hydrolase [Roseomonas sp. BN140053]|uniref:alpha/beta hydrolase n=1 Tax=Roseomonas sp. BN140053 TaxID=3391898 RepID=UPI0039ED93BC